eukprot:COSAG01_NODE_1281_length_10920_cov_39.473480_5_plen_182_part_00
MKIVKVLQHIRLKISPDKTKIGRKYLNFLGHCVSPEVTFANLSRVSGMQNIKGPTLEDPWSKTDVRSWCGAVSYYKCYIPDFSSMTRPLHCLTHDSVKPDSNLTSHWTKRLNKRKTPIITPTMSVGDNISITPRPHSDTATTASSTTRTSIIQHQLTQPQLHGTGCDDNDRSNFFKKINNA